MRLKLKFRPEMGQNEQLHSHLGPWRVLTADELKMDRCLPALLILVSHLRASMYVVDQSSPIAL
jgi:hypothetical protein